MYGPWSLATRFVFAQCGGRDIEKFCLLFNGAWNVVQNEAEVGQVCGVR